MNDSADDLPRLSKRMGELGLCSRREAEAWIVAGWVRVDGTVIDVLGTRVDRAARIEVHPRARAQQAELVTVLLNKPIGYVSGQAEDGYEPASVLIRPQNRWSGDASGRRFEPRHLDGLAPAGRLDIDSTGLMVYTQDGRIAKQLIHRVAVEWHVASAGLRSRGPQDRPPWPGAKSRIRAVRGPPPVHGRTAVYALL